MEDYYSLMDQKKIRNPRGYLIPLIEEDDDDTPSYFLFTSYHHTFYKSLYIFFNFLASFHLTFHSPEDRDQWLKQHGNLEYQLLGSNHLTFTEGGITPVWEILKKEECLALTPSERNRFQYFYERLEKQQYVWLVKRGTGS